jgi:hypothetical protein
MGRKKTDGEAVDVTAPGATLIEKGELYRIDNFTGFAADQIDATEVDRSVALDVSQAVWKVKVPVGTCATRGMYVKWTAAGGATFQKSSTDLLDDTSTRTLNSIGKVEEVRNSAGYAAIKLLVV